MFGKQRGLLWKVFSSLFWLVALVFIAYLLNLGLQSMNSLLYSKFVYFVNSNVAYIILLVLISFIGELIYLLNFPFDTPAPLFKAVSGMMVVSFVFRAFLFLDGVFKTNIYGTLTHFSDLIYFVVMTVILVAGYIMVFYVKRKGSEVESERIEKKEERKVRYKEMGEVKEEGKGISWEEIGGEVRMAIYNLFHTIADALDKKKDKKKRR